MEKRMVLRYRFGRIYIQARSPYNSFVYDFCKGVLHDDAAAAHIHNDGFRLHHPKFLFADKAGSAFIIRSMDRDHIRLPHQTLKRNGRIFSVMARAGSGVIDDFHPKRGSDSGNF